MKNYLIAFLISVLITTLIGKICIPLLKKLNFRQTILKYVGDHKNKNGTPTMGGIIFIIPITILFFIVKKSNFQLSMVSIFIMLSFMVVGFIDDFIKAVLKRNEGLTPLQKIVFQFSISLIVALFSYNNGLSSINIPFINNKLELGVWCVPLIMFIFIAITNSVNLTDGLDGLSAGVSYIYLIVIFCIMYLQLDSVSSNYILVAEYQNLLLLTAISVGCLIGYLVFNTNKATVFMGDTGSLALGGLIGSISVFTSNSLYIPILGLMFVISSLSVIIQVFYYKKTKKRIFLMAPFHHHLQLKGLSEGKIVFIYKFITLVVGIAVIISYL